MNKNITIRSGNFKILDCTLRDGGYYNHWFFSESVAKELITGLSQCNLDYIEVGYRSIVADDGYGPFRYCRDEYLKELIGDCPSEIAVMLDLKEIPDIESLKPLFPDCRESPVSLIRLSGYDHHIPKVNDISRFLKDKGYTTSFNYMGVSLLTRQEMINGLKQLDQKYLDIIYFSDSFGNMTPDGITGYLDLFKNETKCKIGFHGHNNQGLALQNTITAIEHGLDIADCTMYGMGRGAGNTKTEELLLNLTYHDRMKESYKNLLNILEKNLVPLQLEYSWGQSLSYMYSGFMNIHPSYCQVLKSRYRLPETDILEILRLLPDSQKHHFQLEALLGILNLHGASR